MADSRHAVQLFTQKLFVAAGSLHRDLDQVVVFAAGQMNFEHLGHTLHRAFEDIEGRIVVMVQNHLDHHDFRGTELFVIENRPVAGDDSLLFQPPDPLPAGAGREADLLCELRVRNAPVLGQCPEDAAVDLVDLWLWVGGSHRFRSGHCAEDSFAFTRTRQRNQKLILSRPNYRLSKEGRGWI